MQVSALPKRRPHISYSLRLLFGTLLVFIAFWTYGKVYFYRDPGSLLFFDPSRAYERKYSTYREKEVLEFRKEVIKKIQNNGIEDRSDRTKDYQVCAVIVSVDRKINGMNVHPLEITLLSAISNLTTLERRSLNIQVYLANTNPLAHSLTHSPLLNVSNNIVDGVSTPISVGAPGLNLNRLKKYEQERNLNAKTALDFSFALQSCLNSAPRSKYVALIEGDVIFAEGWYSRALAGLAQIEAMKDGRQKTWSDLRLFYPESNTGWAERRWFGNHVPQIILLFNAVIMAVVLGIRHGRAKYFRQIAHSVWLSKATLAVLCLVIIPTLVVTFFAAGKSSLATLILRPGVYSQNWGCCTQTVLFPARNIQPLIRTLQTRTDEATTDSLVMQHAQREGLTRYVLNPVLVQHRGVMASVITPERIGQKAKGLLWSISFEDLDPKRLKSEHFQAVKRIFSRSIDLIAANTVHRSDY